MAARDFTTLTANSVKWIADNCVEAARARGMDSFFEGAVTLSEWHGRIINRIEHESVVSVFYNICMDMYHNNICLSEFFVEDPSLYRNAIEAGDMMVYYAVYPANLQGN